MTQNSFAVTVENTLNALMEQVEEVAPEVEGDLVDSVLTLILPDDSQIIINRQEAVQQIWLACSDGPARFDQVGEAWLDSQSHEPLNAAVGRLLGKRLGRSIALG
ncbi:MAG: iron donor protein CyaY [Acidithiobacillus sp.]